MSIRRLHVSYDVNSSKKERKKVKETCIRTMILSVVL